MEDNREIWEGRTFVQRTFVQSRFIIVDFQVNVPIKDFIFPSLHVPDYGLFGHLRFVVLFIFIFFISFFFKYTPKLFTKTIRYYYPFYGDFCTVNITWKSARKKMLLY